MLRIERDWSSKGSGAESVNQFRNYFHLVVHKASAYLETGYSTETKQTAHDHANSNLNFKSVRSKTPSQPTQPDAIPIAIPNTNSQTPSPNANINPNAQISQPQSPTQHQPKPQPSHRVTRQPKHQVAQLETQTQSSTQSYTQTPTNGLT